MSGMARRAARNTGRILFGTVLLCVNACQPKTATLPALAITNVTVIDAANGTRSNQTVVVDGDQIITVTDDPQTAQRIIDGTGRFLIPGLWDMHVHLTYEPALTAAMPGMFLQYGITSVRDTGGKLDAILPVVTTMRTAGAIAPRVFFSGPLMDGTPVIYDGSGVPEIGIENDTINTARHNVQLLQDAGADFIKIYELVSPEVFNAIASAARDRNMPVAAHVPLSMQASAVGDSAQSLEHLRNIEMDCSADADILLKTRREVLQNPDSLTGMALRGSIHNAQRMLAIESFDTARCKSVLAALINVIQVPTAQLNTLGRNPPWERDDWSQAVQTLPSALHETWRQPPTWYRSDPDGAFARFGDFSQQMILRMHTAGIAIGAGTDTPIARAIPGDSLHSELEVLVAAGLTPLEALRAATLTPARFFGLHETMGAIAPGQKADLVLLEKNPLDDIRNTRTVQQVVYRGQLL